VQVTAQKGTGLRGCSFHGKLLRTAEGPEIRLTEVAYRPQLKNPPHSHEYAYIGITLEGHSTQICKDRVRSSKPWTVMFHPAGERHSDHFLDSGARELNIEISPANLAKVCDRFNGPQSAVEMNGGPCGWLAARLYREFRLMDKFSWLAIEGLTVELLAEIMRHDLKPCVGNARAWLRQVDALIHDCYTERVTLSDLARTVNVHPVHLAREFHRQLGCTIGQQIRRLRIEYACRLLAENKHSLAEIGLAAGFGDQSQFTKTFKTLVGITPSEYRKPKPAAKFRQNC
jgi:AraC family transcriptional regulator